MDPITTRFVKAFLKQNSLDSLAPDRAFEHFAGYLATTAHYQETFSTDSISVGGGSDCGIDCIAVILNGALITDPDEVDDLADTNHYLDVTFVFTQAERSATFECAKLRTFGSGVADFFSDTPQLPRNEQVQLYNRIWQTILTHSNLLTRGNPQCFLYYATTGRWTNDPALCATREAVRTQLEGLTLFRKVTVDCLDADRLQRFYRASQNARAITVTFADRTVIPDIPGVEQAYVGLLPANEFLNLVENDTAEILNAVFYDNVRHWQEWNPVNTQMRETLADPRTKVLFPLLNNGITIVARRLNATGNRFLVEDYQIVNGCQTSFVLHECRDLLTDNIMVPVRLIATQDDAIKNAIIRATNSQTQVTEDQLVALSDFPRKLEEYFLTFEGAHRLYYERRSRQYAADSSVEKVRVINMTVLIRAFASIFLNLPHRTTRNYKTLLGQVGTNIFHTDPRLEPYYVSAWAHYRLDYLFRNQTLPSAMKPARYHLLMAFRFIAQPAAAPLMNSRDMESFCRPIREHLWNPDGARDTFATAAAHIAAVAAGNMHRDNIRTEPFTEALLARLRPQS